jgi:phosphohistidine swiveling domain-containing protein
MTTTPTRYVIGLHEESAGDPAQTGTKAATLARLLAGGFPVPPGFVVTISACERIFVKIDGAETSPGGEYIPGDVWTEVLTGLRELGEGFLAVRSSGAAEDLAGASYAGQYETVLAVQGPEAVAAAIGRCLASASSERVRAYAGPSSASSPMAVLIQRLVQADAAGVAFTANPVTGDDEILVSAVKGLGDRLVSGEVTPDEWIVRDDEASCLRAPEEALNPTQVHEIATLAKEVAELSGVPQDLEWAIAGGELFLLQARPITALPVRPHMDPPSHGFWEKDGSHYPTPLTPFGASVFLPALSAAAAPLAEEFGLLLEGLEFRSLGGEVYQRGIPLGGKDRPPPPSWAMWLGARLMPVLRRRARAAERLIRGDVSGQLLDRWESEWRGAFKNEAEELNRIELAALDDDALLAHLDRLKDMLHRGEALHFQLQVPYVLALYELGRVCEELLGWDVLASLSLLTGSSEASFEPGRELASLGARFASDPKAVRALDEPGEDVLARLREAAPEAAAAFEEYLDRYGHRTMSYDPGDPTLFERPALLAGLLADQMRRTGDTSGRPQTPDDAVGDARAALAQRSEEDRSRFERVLAQARWAYGQREDNIFWLDNQPCALIRYTAVEIGRRLARRGVLARATDVVFLEEQELRDALSRKREEDQRALVARRRAERAWVMAHPGPASYGRDPGPPPDLSPLPPALRLINAAELNIMKLMFDHGKAQDTTEGLTGVPGSPGRYSGPVRVVRDESEFAKLRPGDVLVCPITSPAWSLLFLQAGAVVTDSGGVLSHTAVIAREYGIPAVLATGQATRRLHDGDPVTVDGARGVVTVVSGDDRHRRGAKTRGSTVTTSR